MEEYYAAKLVNRIKSKVEVSKKDLIQIIREIQLDARGYQKVDLYSSPEFDRGARKVMSDFSGHLENSIKFLERKAIPCCCHCNQN